MRLREMARMLEPVVAVVQAQAQNSSAERMYRPPLVMVRREVAAVVVRAPVLPVRVSSLAAKSHPAKALPVIRHADVRASLAVVRREVARAQEQNASAKRIYRPLRLPAAGPREVVVEEVTRASVLPVRLSSPAAKSHSAKAMPVIRHAHDRAPPAP
jgi:hypothetical protein